jgi:hypothetical protein
MLAPVPSMEFESEIIPSGNPDSGKKQHALAFGAGNILAYLLFEVLPHAFSSSGKPSAAAYWIARAWGQHVGKEALRRRARLLQHISRTAGPIIGFVATVSGSIYTGLNGFLVN